MQSNVSTHGMAVAPHHLASQSALAVLRKDYNNGEPERRGDERNFARYQERVAEMKAAIARKEADVAAIRRELSKLPNP